jgi:hypothetical protein
MLCNLGMNQYDQNGINGIGTKPKFEKVMDFYVPVGAILIELRDCSDQVTGTEIGSILRYEANLASTGNSNPKKDRNIINGGSVQE